MTHKGISSRASSLPTFIPLFFPSNFALLLASRMIASMIHSKFRSITHVAIKVHVILWSFVVVTWMRDTIELV